MPPHTTVTITEVTQLTGRKKKFKLRFDGSEVAIPVDETVFAHYQNQFYRKSPTTQQTARFSTLINLMRAAYTQGLKAGKNGRS